MTSIKGHGSIIEQNSTVLFDMEREQQQEKNPSPSRQKEKTNINPCDSESVLRILGRLYRQVGVLRIPSF
jgi:hypothetical protein